jgi:type VI secretion system secreted protein VgrG
MGNIETKAGLGQVTYEAMQGIELKVGGNSIKIDQTGVTIKGLMISIEGQVQTELKGLLTTVNASAMLTVKGAITMIN